jgi:hypothetical protein
MSFIAYLGNMRLGCYAHRENAGRRLLAARRRVAGGWKRLRSGVWKNRKNGLILRIGQERRA